jgi:TRAP-type C4-dicarboxylate transport system substrate-binding protein
MDEHNMIPDFLIIATGVWDRLAADQRAILKNAARAATAFHKELWKNAEDEALKIASEKMGVAIVRPAKQPFIDKVRPLYDEYANDPVVAELVSAIRATQKK